MTKKRRKPVRLRFESGHEEQLELAELIYRELRAFAAILADPRASPKVRAHAEAQLRDAAEAKAEVTLRRARNAPKVSKAQALEKLKRHPRKIDAAADLGISERWLHELTKDSQNRNP